jgi:5-carboxymethyl-2-hydroxymuconate isomerase
MRLMPQILIEYSANLDGRFDSTALAVKVHEAAVEIIATTLESCKSRIVRHERVVIGDGDPAQAMLHIDFRGLSGRTAAQKTALGEAILALAVKALAPAPLRIEVTVEIGDLDRENYHKRVVQ